MKTSMPPVEDSEENRQACMKFCGVCPTCRAGALDRSAPGLLFCARGPVPVPPKKDAGCYCPACEIFTRHSLVIGHFCSRR